MPHPTSTPTSRVNAWVYGILTVIPGLIITFSSDHSAAFTSMVFAVWAIGTGTVLAVLHVREPASEGAHARVRWATLKVGALWVLTVAAGMLALTLAPSEAAVTTGLGVWATVFGLGNIAAWVLDRSATAAADRRFLGLTATGLGLALLSMSVNMVVTCGLFGAWAVVTGVWSLLSAIGPGTKAAS